MRHGNASATGSDRGFQHSDSQNSTCRRNSDGAGKSGKVTASISGRRDVTIKAIVFAVAKIDTLRNCSTAGESGDQGTSESESCFLALISSPAGGVSQPNEAAQTFTGQQAYKNP